MIASHNKNKLEQKMLQNEQVYRRACELFGGSPRVFRYYDQTDEISMDLLTAENSPCEGAVSYSTVGLQHHSVGLRMEGKPLRVEIAAACYSRYEYYPNLLSACSFEIINARFGCCHGAVYRDCVNMYVQGSPMKHLLFTACRLWEKDMDALVFDDKKTIWLTAVPISDSELLYLEENTSDTLLERLNAAGADFLNLERKSIF